MSDQTEAIVMDSDTAIVPAAQAGPKATDRTREAINKLTAAFHAYYNVNTVDPLEPFSAEATFSLHNEQYLLVKAARVSQMDSFEFVYFGETETLTEELYHMFENAAWEDGLKRTKPGVYHRNSDVTCVIVAESVDPEAAKAIKRSKHHKSYKFSFNGWSTYRAVTYDLSKGEILYNRRGTELKKVFSNIKLF